MLFVCRLLQRRELAVQQRCRHEMTAAVRQAFDEHVTRNPEIDESNLRARVAAQHIAIDTLQRRARDDDPDTFAMGDLQLFTERGEPRGAVGICQRDTPGHLRDIRRRVVIVTLQELDAGRSRETRSDEGFPRSGDTHHDVEASVHWREVERRRAADTSSARGVWSITRASATLNPTKATSSARDFRAT